MSSRNRNSQQAQEPPRPVGRGTAARPRLSTAGGPGGSPRPARGKHQYGADGRTGRRPRDCRRRGKFRNADAAAPVCLRPDPAVDWHPGHRRGRFRLRTVVRWTSAEEKGDLDAELLSSDLPIDAYLDRDSRIGFRPLTKTTDAGRGLCRGPRACRPAGGGAATLPSPRWTDLSPRSSRCSRRSPGVEPARRERKQKWRAIAQRYRACRPTSSSACSSRCARGATDPAGARRGAREVQVDQGSAPEKKNEVRQRWEEYQKLPPEKKRELAAQPPAQGKPASGQPSIPGRVPAPR